MRAVLFFGIIVLSFSVNVWDAWAEKEPKKVSTSLSRNIPLLSGVDARYQIGPEWGKKVVTKESLKNESEVFNHVALQTARFGGSFSGATAFYLGKFNGEHVMASNYHVITNKRDCQNGRATFTISSAVFKCKKFLGSWSDVDFALVTIDVKPDDEHLLVGVGKNMAFNSPIYKGQKLLTIGHGVANNEDQKLVANQDDDCIVYSEGNDIRFMADPDDLNPGDYSVWSFANGCDVSHGDSGSAMVDRLTGDIVGIIWTGRIPKDKKVQDSSYLGEIYSTNSEEIWKQLSYAAPATKIKEVLLSHLDSDDMDIDTAETIRQILH